MQYMDIYVISRHLGPMIEQSCGTFKGQAKQRPKNIIKLAFCCQAQLQLQLQLQLS